MIELTGWESLGISVDWAAIEGELGVLLPADYKELYEVFGGGVFSDSLYFLGRDEGPAFDFLTQWRFVVVVVLEEEMDRHEKTKKQKQKQHNNT
ncbi:SMI1/KNR4 family protein, partial [Streptomyces sp. NPDC059349]|uniref:SMI1/KNR4 family protein n=1 Tax=Streptomyces sp. NPDC059349 TaxID=3346808 RepID=UPI0036776BED